MQIYKANPWRILGKDLLKHLSVLAFAKCLHAPVTLFAVLASIENVFSSLGTW